MTEQPKAYTPLTSANAALVLVDHQVGLMTGVRDYSTGELKHNVVALAKAAKALKVPTVVTTTARDSMWGPTFPELVEALEGDHEVAVLQRRDARQVLAASQPVTGRRAAAVDLEFRSDANQSDGHDRASVPLHTMSK